ncbi:hypothetical protein [Neolewinella agarilytica]|uniref:Uncharacterized protein n=1 Tax=Neolewinella agarilytica TaxID=478744 RepID=A0A1H9H9U8_9BACT|nr:hypothetical protein [Neolewinella agarilytica]SEQ59105.1 hypothetical protein SAMN05444359_11274 [Neolewinella agarilytica]
MNNNVQPYIGYPILNKLLSLDESANNIGLLYPVLLKGESSNYFIPVAGRDEIDSIKTRFKKKEPYFIINLQMPLGTSVPNSIQGNSSILSPLNLQVVRLIQFVKDEEIIFSKQETLLEEVSTNDLIDWSFPMALTTALYEDAFNSEDQFGDKDCSWVARGIVGGSQKGAPFIFYIDRYQNGNTRPFYLGIGGHKYYNEYFCEVGKDFPKEHSSDTYDAIGIDEFEFINGFAYAVNNKWKIAPHRRNKFGPG